MWRWLRRSRGRSGEPDPVTDSSTGGVWRRRAGAGAGPAPAPVKGDRSAPTSPVGKHDRMDAAGSVTPDDVMGPEWGRPDTRRYRDISDIPHVGPGVGVTPAPSIASPLRSVAPPPAPPANDPPRVSTSSSWATFDPVEAATDDLVGELSARLIERAGDDREAAWAIDDPAARADELLADLDLDGYSDIVRERVEAEARGGMLAAAEELAERQREGRDDDDDPW